MRRAWLLRKELTQFVEHPLYVLVVELSAGRSAPEASSTALAQKLVSAVTLPGEYFIVPLVKSTDWLDAPVRRLPQTLVHTGASA